MLFQMQLVPLRIGAVLATKDGLWPAAENLPRIENSLWEGCGVKLWWGCVQVMNPVNP